MAEWDSMELGRVLLALSAVLYAGIWVQVSLMHWGGAFRRVEMWGPVIASPLIILAILGGFAARDGILGWIAAAFLAVGVLEGLGGLFFHVRAISYQVGGLGVVRNYVTGPPPVLPVAYSLAGVAGLLGLLWNA